MSSSDSTSVRRSKALIGAGCTGPTGPAGPTGVTLDTAVTTAIYVDFLRSDSYVATGSRNYPFKTLALAYTLAYSTATDSNPKIIVLLSGNTTPENIVFSKGHIFLIGEHSSGTHAPIVFTGSLTFTGPSASISSNHFAVTGLAIVGVSGVDVITFSGTNPQRLFMKDVWVTANGTSHGITMINSGVGSTLHTNDCKFSHNGSGHYHCVNVAAGTANIDTSESSGTTVGAFGITNGSCNITSSDIQAAGSYAIDVYAGGILSIANSKITTTAADSIGISLTHATAIAVVGNVSFSVPASSGAGRAISGVSSSGPYGLYYGPMYFLPIGIIASNDKVSSLMAKTPIDATFTSV